MKVDFVGSFAKLNPDPGFYQCRAVSCLKNDLMNSVLCHANSTKITKREPNHQSLNINTNKQFSHGGTNTDQDLFKPSPVGHTSPTEFIYSI